MRLFEHTDFEQAIIQAAEHFRGQGLQALRAIAVGERNRSIIFKGGTSLSKGWNLIQRFSEDIDIFLDPLAFEPPLGKRAIGRQLKRLRDAVAEHPALTFVEGEGRTIGGFGRNDHFSYEQRFGGPGEVANRVLLEAGWGCRWEPKTKVRSQCGCFISAGHSWRRCSPFTAKSNSSSETGERSAATRATITISIIWRCGKR